MSKSLGNVIDPLEMIDRYGADALRFALARAGDRRPAGHPASRGARSRPAGTSRTRSGTPRGWCCGAFQRRRARSCRRQSGCTARRAVAALAAPGLPGGGRRGPRRVPVRRRRAGAAALRRGPSSATGVSSWRRGGWTGPTQERADAAAGAGVGPRADAPPAASDDAVRDRGDLAAVRHRRVDRDRRLARAAPRARATRARSRSLGLVQEVVTAMRQFRAQHHIPSAQALAVTVGVPDADQRRPAGARRADRADDRHVGR